jgi:YD repeat-containing protein
MAQGAPMQMRDAQGNLLELHRDKQRNLFEIRTPPGHWMKVEHDAQDRITRAEDDAGNWTRYSYDTDGMLADVIHSSGREKHYKYADGAMIEVRDEKGSLLLRNSYDGGLVVRQEFSNGDIYNYGYKWPRNGYYPDQVTVRGPRGFQQSVSVAESVPQYIKSLRTNQK